MGKLLFLSNSTKPSKEEYEFVGEEQLDNISIPSVKAAGEMGIQVTIGTNRKYAKQMTCTYPVSFYNAEIYRNPFNIREVRQAYQNACAELRSDDYTAIHCNTPIGGFVGRVAGKKCNIGKVIYQAHGFHFYNGAPFVNWLLYYPVERLLARWTDAIITINHEDYSFAQKKMKLRKGGKVYYVPGVGIDTERFAPDEAVRQSKRQELGLSDDDVMLISAGDLNKNKNNTVLVSALSKLQNKKIHYFLCGVGDKEKDLRQQAQEAGLSENVHFLGYRRDMKELLQAADVFVMPSLREGLSRSIMEAMSAGLPCVVSKIRGNVDLVSEGQGGYLHAPADADTAADAIEKLANDRELRQAMRTFNLEKVKQFDSSVVEREIQKIYAELLPAREKVMG